MAGASTNPHFRQELAALSAGICKAVNHRKRLMLLYALGSGPHTVKELCELIEDRESNTSQHLAVLRGQGLVEAQRQGPIALYSLRQPKVIHAIDLLRQVMHEEIDRQQALRSSPTTPGGGSTAISTSP